ncbi:MAG: hypothetical protein GVY05_00330 [Bacteroidetes bacterium]|jgi:hypothetical protein|nr:hypothetical protein [Bacteroidota bacterium]
MSVKSVKLLFVLWICFSIQIYGQCNYERIKYDNKTNKATLKLSPITLDLYETPLNGRIILASLIRIDNTFFIEIEITKDSKTQKLEPICFKQGTKLSFSLKNNTIISLFQREKKICGVNYYDKKNNYSSVSNYARFILTQQAYDELIQSEVILMKIIAKNYENTFVLKTELEEQFEDQIITTNPSRFFMDNIKCLTNPQFK